MAGGPIRKNRLFVFGDFEGDRIIAGQGDIATVPTTLMREGDFSDLLNPDPSANQEVKQLYLPGRPVRSNSGQIVGGQFACQNNVIFNLSGNCPSAPAPNQSQQVALKLLTAFPSPNYGPADATYNNYNKTTKVPDNTNQMDVRVDWNIDANDQSFARYSLNHETIYTPSLFPAVGDQNFYGGTRAIQGRNFAGSENHVFNPKTDQ